MRIKQATLKRKQPIFTLIFLLLSLGLVFKLEISASAQVPEVEPFLYPPFHGSAAVSSVFDHQTPRNIDPNDGVIVTYNGLRATGPPSQEVDYTTPLWNYTISYDQHEGIDFRIAYQPILAAADSSRVARADWHYPAYRDAGLGLFIRLEHNNGYDTMYGHLSSIAVTSCGSEDAPCTTDVRHGDVIGISGGTGVGAPHFHFEVRRRNNSSNNQSVDPYGWDPVANPEVQNDPWGAYEQASSLWVVEPDVSVDVTTILPPGEGNALPRPSGPNAYPPDSRSLIDEYAHLWTDTDQPPPDIPNFSTSSNCWTRSGAKPEEWAINGFNLSQGINEGTCWARWHLPQDRVSGRYKVFVHVAQSHSTLTDGAIYTVVAAGHTRAAPLISQREINEKVLRSGTHSSDPTVDSGWIDIGEYHFVQGYENYVELGNETAANDPSDAIIIADAIQFVLLEADATPTPSPTPSPTPTPTPEGISVIVQVDQRADDAGDEAASCAFSTTWNELYFGECANGSDIVSGFRFAEVEVPQQAAIHEAYLRFTTDGPYTDDITVRFFGEANAYSNSFSNTNRPEDRTVFSNSVLWHIIPADEWALGNTRNSPSLVSIVQQIINQSDWEQGNPLAIIVKNAGLASGNNRHRRVIGFDRPSWYPGTEYAAELVVRYSGGIVVPTPGPSPTPLPSPTSTSPPPPPPKPCNCFILCMFGIARNEVDSFAGKVAVVGYHALTSLQESAELVALLTQVRDDVMAGTPGGDHLINLYADFSPELAKIILTRPELEQEGREVIDLFIPHLEALVEGKGDEIFITQEQVAAVASFLDHLSEASGEELQATIEKEQNRLHLDDLAGLTMEDAWNQVHGYALSWLPPLSNKDPYHAALGQTIPVKFEITDLSGAPVLDESVTLSVYDALGTLFYGPIGVSSNPDLGIDYQGARKYHYNLPTESLHQGPFDIVIQYRSTDGSSASKQIDIRGDS